MVGWSDHPAHHGETHIVTDLRVAQRATMEMERRDDRKLQQRSHTRPPRSHTRYVNPLFLADIRTELDLSLRSKIKLPDFELEFEARSSLDL